MLPPRHRLIALHVDVNVRRDRLSNFVHAIGPTAVSRRCHAEVPSVRPANLGDLLGISSYDYVIQLSAGARGLVDMRQHGTSIDLAQNLAREAGGSKTGRDDGDGFHAASLLGKNLVAQARNFQTIVRI